MPKHALVVPLLGAALSFASVFLALALAGAGLPLWLGALLAALCVGLVLYAWPTPQAEAGTGPTLAEQALRQQMEAYLAEVGSLRHDLRGVLSPAMMMTDRLLRHPDPAVQRAGAAVVRSIERATTLLASNKATLGNATVGNATVGPTVPGAATPTVADASPAQPAR